MINKFFRSNWVITIGGSIISTVVCAVLLHYYNEVSIWEAFKSIGRFVLQVFNYGVRLWIIIIAIFAWWLFARIRKTLKQQYTTQPTVNAITLRSMRWSWEWFQHPDGQWDIQNIRIDCPNCKKLMIYHPEHGAMDAFARCPYCRHMVGSALYGTPQIPREYEIRTAIKDELSRTHSAQ